MVAPLQAKTLQVEIDKTSDQVIERSSDVRSRRRRRQGLDDSARLSSRRHHAARRALEFASRCVFFEAGSEFGSAASVGRAAATRSFGSFSMR
jgi:hypothetical protein